MSYGGEYKHNYFIVGGWHEELSQMYDSTPPNKPKKWFKKLLFWKK